MYGRMSATYSPRLRELDEMRPMQRLCFLLPDVANERTELGDLPDAGKIEESDFYPQLKRGLALGGAIGVIGGLIAMRAVGQLAGKPTSVIR